MLNVNRTMKYLVGLTGAFLSCLQAVNPQALVIKREWFARGFLTVKAVDRKILADGEQTQTPAQIRLHANGFSFQRWFYSGRDNSILATTVFKTR